MLGTLNSVLSFVSDGCIFEPDWHNTLLEFYHFSSYPNIILQCLTKVGSLQFYRVHRSMYGNLYKSFIEKLQEILPSTVIRAAYADGDDETKDFIKNIAIYFISFFKSHISELKFCDKKMSGFAYLLNIAHVDDTYEPLDWSRKSLNTLCWAIGSLSGSMTAEQEAIFLKSTIDELTKLYQTRESIDRDFIAINIIYAVGQYPRYLRAHWPFLKAFVNRLIEHMDGKHRAVQGMACDILLKVVKKCKREFVIVQDGEREEFVSELLSNLATILDALEPHLIHTVYESVVTMIQAQTDSQKRRIYWQRLMQFSKTNKSAAKSSGIYFLSRVSLIFKDMLSLCRMCDELISRNIAEGGPCASHINKLLWSVKRETLELIGTFLDKPENQTQYMPQMMDSSVEYAWNLSNARESEFSPLFGTVINKCKGAMIDDVPQFVEAIFRCLLGGLKKNSEDYSEHRLKFLSLLHNIDSYTSLIKLSNEELKDVTRMISNFQDKQDLYTGRVIQYRQKLWSLITARCSWETPFSVAALWTEVYDEVSELLDNLVKHKDRRRVAIGSLIVCTLLAIYFSARLWMMLRRRGRGRGQRLGPVLECVGTLVMATFSIWRLVSLLHGTHPFRLSSSVFIALFLIFK